VKTQPANLTLQLGSVRVALHVDFGGNEIRVHLFKNKKNKTRIPD